MRLGLQGVLPSQVDELTNEPVETIRDAGYAGVAVYLGLVGVGDPHDPDGVTEEDCAVVRAYLAAAGLEVAYSWSFWPSLVAPDEGVRAQALEIARGALRVARDLGASFVPMGSGSNDPRGAWIPHRDNQTTESLGRTIRSFFALASSAEEYGVTIVVKGHSLSTLDTSEKLRLVVEAVGSPFVRTSADPTNMATMNGVLRPREHVDRIFDVLGDHIVMGHVKDAYLEENTVVKVTEVPIGAGTMDNEHFLARMQELRPDAWMVAEHIAVGEYAAATAAATHLRALARFE